MIGFQNPSLKPENESSWKFLINKGLVMKKVDKAVVENLEQQKNDALKRIAERLKDQAEAPVEGHSAHNSHSSGSGRGHTSFVSS